MSNSSSDFIPSLANEGIKSLDEFDIGAITKRYEILFKKLIGHHE